MSRFSEEEDLTQELKERANEEETSKAERMRRAGLRVVPKEQLKNFPTKE